MAPTASHSLAKRSQPAQAAPAASATQVVFAKTPQTLGIDDLISYSMKRGKDIYNQGCKALDNKALMMCKFPGSTYHFFLYVSYEPLPVDCHVNAQLFSFF